MRKIIIVTLLSIVSTYAYTQQEANSITYTNINKEQSKKLAKHYGLTQDEIKKYKDYMEVEGKYNYAHLDPVWVLGLIADSEEDMYRYAKKAIIRETKSIQDLSKFLNVYTKVGVELGINKTLGKDKTLNTIYTPKNGDEFVFILDKVCDELCIANINSIFPSIDLLSTKLTVYLKDAKKGQKEILAQKMTSIAKGNKNIAIAYKNYDSMEFKLDQIIFNRILIKRAGNLHLYQL